MIKRIQSINETPFSVEINTNREMYKASYLISADGANSIVRRFVSKGPGRFYQKQFAIEADVKIDRPDNYKMEFDFSRSKKGYYWIFPKDDHVNIGIYSTDLRTKPQTQRLYEYAKAILESEYQVLSARDLYLKKLKTLQTDLRIYELSSKWFYRFPKVSLRAVGFSFIHNRFVKGYGQGKTITQIFSGK